ncbi:hypothetical protein RvY_17791 [Ramazzottius varieornatus]|uniref:Uncharacterized protein n=1 Tax=Ramazzottius varieornatus TaxID=947166 RepID=A0A1D1W5E8_RAMVA|nr:hypothetical protein RvY_17791 [Ramazzottius varieornatus]
MPIPLIHVGNGPQIFQLTPSCSTFKNVFQRDTGLPADPEKTDTDVQAATPEPLHKKPKNSARRRVPNVTDFILHRDTLSAAPVLAWTGRRGLLTAANSSPTLLGCHDQTGMWTPSSRAALYGIFKPTHSWKESMGLGSTFVTKFSPSGKLLMAGYENRVIDIIYVSQNSSTRIENGHSDCVNNACWIDELHFATGSDDQKVSVWDVRKCTSPLASTKIYHPQPREQFHLGEADLNIKDLHYFPSELPSHPAYLIVTTFAASVFRLELAADFRLRLPAPCLTSVPVKSGCSRSALFPAGHLYAGKLIVSYRDSCCLDIVDVLSQPLKRPKGGSTICGKHEGRFTKFEEETVEPFRSLTVDPTGKGFLAGHARITKLHGRRSNVTYYSLQEEQGKFKSERKLFFPQKGSESVYQSSSFSKNGYFIASPQDRRVDILTNGESSQLFSEQKGGPKQFTLASVLPFPKCGDIICTDVSPMDNCTVASGCELGHVHLSQPAF